MAHRLLRDTEADGWERSDFPIICESCLGDNPYVRMTKANFDKECKICTRPFTVFRWRPGREARYKKTEVCQTCSKLKNVCQVCLLDLEYGLPVQVRDTALGMENDQAVQAIPKSDVNREFFAEEADRKAKSGQDFEASHGRAKPNDLILKLQRTTPYYKRNRAHICSFFVRGECTRGAECPYRHEMPVEGPLAHQNLKDRYYGVNDPVAAKLLQKAGEMPSLAPPEDQSVVTLYVGGLDQRVTEQDLRDHFYGWGEIASVKLVPTKQCAFVTYTTREGAERAAENLANKLVVKGLRLRLMWGKPHMQKGEEGLAGGPRPAPSSVIHSGLLPRAVLPTQQMAHQGGGTGAQTHQAEPPPPASAPVNYFNMPPPPPAAIATSTAGNEQVYYPSMDPEQMGAARPKAGGGSGDDAASRASGSTPSGPPAPPQRPLPPPRPFPPPPYGPGPPMTQGNQQQSQVPPPPGVAPSPYGYGQSDPAAQQQYYQPPQQEGPPGYGQGGMQPRPPGVGPPPAMLPRGYHQQYMSRPQYYSRGNY